MPTQVTNYQCPACTGPLHFVGASGKLECEYCGASYEVAEIEALYAEKEEKAAVNAENMQNSENHNSRIVKTTNQEFPESQFKNDENHTSRIVEITTQ